ncbi:GNAT family N-acetyltransferase [Kribbella sp. NBC_01245]|uniref:GNAT family N-acetyltransferase n=1 Tax=Kribbella sp. NBC_01245 TaxID=2903578 RepID=UPI002E2C7BB1|nr:GNAT family N-acetyltransferase [Kribbella sp. NBC_01245]
MSGLSARDIGHRVVVRYRLPEPVDGHTRTDVLGVLQALDGQGLVVRRADASLEAVPLDRVEAAKPIQAIPLRRVDRDQLLLATGLNRPAAETIQLGDWLLRASGGWTGRGNSLLPYGDPGMPVEKALAEVADFYRTRRLPPLALTVLGSPLEEVLRDEGWVDARPHQSDVLILHTSIDLVNADPGYEVQVTDRPDDEWYDATAEVVPAIGRQMLEGPTGPVGFASIRIDGQIAAVGRGAMTGHWLGIDTVHVRDAYRRRGLGTAVLRGLARWAGSLGARRTYLEVVEENTPALTTYTTLSFTEAYRYRYRTLP